jgi:hypothetical protein
MTWRVVWDRLLAVVRLRPPSYVQPGVCLAEVASPSAIPYVPMYPMCLAGECFRGPAGQPVLITSRGHMQAVLVNTCPCCGARPFDQFLPGIVTRWGRVWWAPWRRRPPYAVICRACKATVAWEWDGRRVRPREDT